MKIIPIKMQIFRESLTYVKSMDPNDHKTTDVINDELMKSGMKQLFDCSMQKY